jgi:hypothetical protein
MMKAKGSPKPVASGKSGNVGGVATPGRKGSHAAAMMAGVKNLVAPGPGTKKTAVIGKVRPEQNQGAKIPSPPSVSAPQRGQALTQKSAGVVKPHGTVNVSSNIRPEGAIKRDAASVIKPGTN